ncbi:MAG: hypothetical protein LBL74_04325 [Bacteroidales bacterium]|nr:hypothetical protein [Bacteroidales bacterium]
MYLILQSFVFVRAKLLIFLSRLLSSECCFVICLFCYASLKGCLAKMKQPLVRTKQRFGKIKGCFIFPKAGKGKIIAERHAPKRSLGKRK